MAQAYSRTWLFADAPSSTLDVNCESIMDQWSCNRDLATGKGPDPVLDETRKKIANQSWPQLEIAVGKWRVFKTDLEWRWRIDGKGRGIHLAGGSIKYLQRQAVADPLQPVVGRQLCIFESNWDWLRCAIQSGRIISAHDVTNLFHVPGHLARVRVQLLSATIVGSVYSEPLPLQRKAVAVVAGWTAVPRHFRSAAHGWHAEWPTPIGRFGCLLANIWEPYVQTTCWNL